MGRVGDRDVLNERIEDLEKVIEILTVLRDHPEIGEKKLCEEHGMSFARYRKFAYDTDLLDHTKSASSEESTAEKMRATKPTLSWYHKLWCVVMGLNYRDVAACPSDVDTTLEWLINTKLSSREGTIIRMQFADGMTQYEIGREYNITGDRVGQIEAKAIRKLRNCSGWLQMDLKHWAPILKIQQRMEQNLELAATHRVLAALDDRIPSLRKFITDGIKNEIAEQARANPDMPIEDMELSVRAFNCLKRAGITTLDDLRHMTPSELMHVRNLGAGCVREIKKKLDEYGFCLLPDDNDDKTE